MALVWIIADVKVPVDDHVGDRALARLVREASLAYADDEMEWGRGNGGDQE